MRYPFLAVVLAMTLVMPGCGKKPTTTPSAPVVVSLPERVEKARKTGELAAYAFIVAYKGDSSAPVLIAVESSIRRLNDVLKEYPKKGFKSVMPELKKGIDAHFDPDVKKAENLLACKLAEVLLEELDNQFAKHPEWNESAEPYVATVQAFVSGATMGFRKYRIEKSIKEAHARRPLPK